MYLLYRIRPGRCRYVTVIPTVLERADTHLQESNRHQYDTIGRSDSTPMFISQFQISNYKSFHKTEPIMLSRGINVVTGQNNAGKTALLQSLLAPDRPHRSIKALPAASSLAQPASGIALTVTLSHNELLRCLAGNGRFFLPVPKVNARFDSVPTLSDYKHPTLIMFKDWFFSQDSVTLDLIGRDWRADGERYDGGGDGYLTLEVQPMGQVNMIGPSLVPSRKPEIEEIVGKNLGNMMYRFEAERFNIGTCPSGSNPSLAPRATNLPEVLDILQGNHVAFDRFNQQVSDILPQIARITVVPEGQVQRKILIWMSDAYNEARRDLAFDLEESGTGIGQVLAILYVVTTSQTPQVILIDEPQSFLHPGAARKLIEVLKQYPRHQYIVATHSPTIITAAKPETIILVTHDGNESHIQHLDANDADHLRRYLDEIGASLADVFGADNILWVEGITEEKCYPLIVEKLLKRFLMGTVIKAVIATGDLEGKHAERFFEIYDRLSSAQSLLPPALGFIFDDDGRSETDKNILRSRGKGREKNKDRVYFTKRLMYENYLLDPKAIAEVLNTTEGHIKTVTETDVQGCIDMYLAEPSYYKNLNPNRSGIEWIRADLLLKKVFAEVAGLDYRKTTHSIELTEWVLANETEKLTEVAELIREALG